jgi:asparagine synthase (glutamine-hydrolysing)
MRFSVEGRVPFLDTRLRRLLWSLELSAIVQKGWNNRALRDATEELLPPLVRRRFNKIGFTTPEDSWVRRIKNEVYLVLSSASFGSRPYFDQAAVLRASRVPVGAGGDGHHGLLADAQRGAVAAGVHRRRPRGAVHCGG